MEPELNQALREAIRNGKLYDVEKLILEGADVNFITYELYCPTPLHLASASGHKSVVSCLLKNGALVNQKDLIWGQTPLHFAAEGGHETVVSCLLKNGAFVNEQDFDLGQTPLHLAVAEGHEQAIVSLINHGANFDAKDHEGNTPLYLAALKKNETHLHAAARYGIEAAISTCLQNGDSLNGKNAKKFTPLHLAALSGSRSTTVALLNNGAIMEEKDFRGMTAMDLAEKYNSKDVTKLYKKILASGLPRELVYLSTQDGATFTSNLRSGFYLSFVGKIMCVGNEAVGKTAITTVLKGGKPSKVRKSTEGIDLHIYKAAVDMEAHTWVFRELDSDDVAFRDLLNKPKIIVPNLNNLDEVENTGVMTSNVIEEEYIINNQAQHKDRAETQLEDTVKDIQDIQEIKVPTEETSKRRSTFQWIKRKLGLEKVRLSTAEELQEESVRRGQQGLISSSLAPINMMDFGGQTAFYSTHQSFLTYRGIYILVIDGSRNFDAEIESDIFIPGRYCKPTAREFTLFWVSSIESYSKGGSDKFPKILVVCTHKDKVPKGEVDKSLNSIFTEIQKMFQGTTAMKHLVLQHRIFINALNHNDPDYEKLKTVLIDLLCSQPSWGEKLPKSWIHLKMMINRSVENGGTIMTLEALRRINKENPVQVLSEGDLHLFLNMHHSQGEIIYFPLKGLRDTIVISPQFLVNALRSLITDKRFCDGHRQRVVESMNQNGILMREDIDDIWKENEHLYRHKQFLLSLMVHLDIIAASRQYTKSGTLMKSDFFYVPSIVKTAADTHYFIDGLEAKALGQSLKFHSKLLPPAIGYRLIASCVDMFEIKRYNDKTMLFSGMIVVRVKRNLDLVVILRSNRVDIYLVHNTSRFEIVRDTAAGIFECLKDILVSILESYKVTSTEGKIEASVPFHTQFQCFDIVSPCYNEGKDDWTCKHGHRITKEIKAMWTVDRSRESCTADCQGLSGTDLIEKPSELHLAKLVLQFTWKDLKELVLRLGLTVTEIETVLEDYGSNLLNVMFLCLRKWRIKTDGTVGDFIKAIHDMDLDVHATCKMIRDNPMHFSEEIRWAEPTDKLLDAISNEVITESLLLSVQLGLKASFWLKMKDDRDKIVKINREVLGKWRSEHPGKDKMKDLAQALCNVGLHITTLLSDT